MRLSEQSGFLYRTHQVDECDSSDFERQRRLTTVSDVCAWLQQQFPVELAEGWDNTGLLLGRRTSAVDRMLTCLTLTSEVAEEAVRESCQMVITHHPVLFRPVQQITDQTNEGRTLLRLIESGVSVYSPHTSFDSAADGINQSLAQSIGLTQIRPLQASDQSPDTGAGRYGELEPPQSLEEVLERVAGVTSTTWLKVARSGQSPVRRIAIGCGAAEGFLRDAERLGCDCFVTGEARFHTVLAARSAGIHLILTGHYSSERPAVVRLAERLSESFPGTECSASQAERNPIGLFQL